MADEDGWYSEYLPVPPELLPDAPTEQIPDAAATVAEIDDSILGILTNWRYVVADLRTMHGVDLWSAEVRASPWPGIRTLIFSLLEPDSPSRLRKALTRR